MLSINYAVAVNVEKRLGRIGPCMCFCELIVQNWIWKEQHSGARYHSIRYLWVVQHSETHLEQK